MKHPQPAVHLIERSQPAQGLESFVDNLQLLSLPAGGPLPRVLPGTGALCFFPLRCGLTVTSVHEARQQVISTPFVVCNRHQVLDFSAVGPARLLVVTFRPGRLRYFTSTGFAQLQDRISDAVQLWGNGVAQLCAELSARTNPSISLAECIEPVSGFFLRVLRESRETRLDVLMDMLYLSPQTRISDIAEEAGWSLRHFERLFASTYGVSPKFFARVTRLQRVARRLALDPATSVSGSALDAGFFDQSHFVHELRRLAGLSPAELMLSLRERPHFYNPRSLHAYAAMVHAVRVSNAHGMDAPTTSGAHALLQNN